MADDSAPKAAFDDLDPNALPTIIPSLCMNCHEQGETTLLLTRIPHFKEIVIMAFECPHCHFKNNEVQSAREINEKGVHMTCTIKNSRDLNRQVRCRVFLPLFLFFSSLF